MAKVKTYEYNDPVYNTILQKTFDIEAEQGSVLWNYFMYGTPYDPSEETYLDEEGNVVDTETAKRAMAGEVFDVDKAEDFLKNQGYKAAPADDGLRHWWNRLSKKEKERHGNDMFSDSAQAVYLAVNPGAGIDTGIKYTDPEGNALTAEEWNTLVNQAVVDSTTAADKLYTQTTRGEYEGYDPDAITSEAELTQQGIEYQSRALTEREPLRTAFNEKALQGLDTEKYARQAASDASQTYDASRQGLSTNLALRGAAPTENNMGNSMERAGLIAGAKTQGRNWAETESFNRLSAALNSPA